jgi:phosphoribosylanthranilate isomerase
MDSQVPEASSGPATRVKICGLTRVSDAVLAEELGANAIGVVMASDSPRSIEKEQAKAVFSAAGPFTLTVVVTHTRSEDEFEAILRMNPGGVQITHPFAVPAWYRGKVIRVIGAGDEIPSDCDAIALDESCGTGRSFNPAGAAKVIGTAVKPVIICGGLEPANVRAVIERYRPYAVDVCSGVEERPGVKDPDRLRAFFRAVRSC